MPHSRYELNEKKGQRMTLIVILCFLSLFFLPLQAEILLRYFVRISVL